MTTTRPNLTVVLPTKREAANLPYLFTSLHAALDDVVDGLEILVVDTPTDDGSEAIVKARGGRYIGIPGGFADALRTGFAAATHEWVVTMDADGSHDPTHIRWMLAHRDHADVVLSSRYVPRAGQSAAWFRCFTSRILNLWLGTLCSLPIKDFSGGFKLYRKRIFQDFEIQARAFEVQSEIAIKAYGAGYRLLELPFYYHPRLEGRSKAAIVRYGMAFLKSSLRLRSFRNSRAFCDYDERAYNSRIPIQRYWQRTRHARIIDLLPVQGACLDLGCGTDRLILGFPQVVGLEIAPNILRYLSQEERRLVQATAERLPFRSATFDQVYCNEVAEHLAADSPLFAELARVLKPGGKALITTPDYGHAWWPMLESVYEAMLGHNREGHGHPSRYTEATLRAALEAQGLRLVRHERIFGSLLAMLVEKPA